MNGKSIRQLEERVRILEGKVDVYSPVNDHISEYRPVNVAVRLIMDYLNVKLKLISRSETFEKR